MSTEKPTEFDVLGLVIFDRADLPDVSIASDRASAGNTTVDTSLSYEELRDKAMEYYALALAVRDLQSSPDLDRVMALIRENSSHTFEEARSIALGMIEKGVSVDV